MAHPVFDLLNALADLWGDRHLGIVFGIDVSVISIAMVINIIISHD